ncbi:MAG: hypothetical protein ABWZ63_10160 [Thermoleophilaceae bacterium]
MASLRPLTGALLLALALFVAACGGDDEEPETVATSPPPAETTEAETEEAPTESETEIETETEIDTETEIETETLPEDEPGGAGDEEPARSLALFTGENGQVRPRVVRVPAFISIRVELRTNDGGSYGLKIDGRTLEVSGGLASVSSTLDGLRPGDAYVGTLTGAEGRVRIEATAEPGP